MLQKIFCFFGWHKLEPKTYEVGSIKIFGRECKYCGYSPTFPNG